MNHKIKFSMLFVFIVLSLLTFVSCKDEKQTQLVETNREMTKNSNTKKTAEKIKKTKKKTSEKKTLFILTEKGLGKINAATLFDKKVISELFKDFIVKINIWSTEGETFLVFEVRDNNELLFVVTPNKKKIFSIIIKTEKIKDTNNYGVGMVFNDDLIAKCVPGMEEYHGDIICFSNKNKSIRYVFSGKTISSGGEVPPKSVLKTIKMKELVWVNQ